MSKPARRVDSRREFLRTTGRIAAVSALAGVAVPPVHAAEDNTIRVALIGCGGRGTGAAAQRPRRQSGPIKLVAMADVFEDRADGQLRRPAKAAAARQVDVPEDRKFIGFDAYKKAMDCLKPGDVAILATPPAFRWVHFTYAIEKGMNVFMEKPVTVDGPTTRKMLALGDEVGKKNLKVGVGLMCRHCEAPAASCSSGSTTARSATSSRCGPIACTARSARLLVRPQADGHERAAVPDPPVPRFPLGQRRLLQRLLHPQHRRVLLDEGRLAGQGPGARRPPLPRQLHRPELRQLLGRIHVRRRHEAVPLRPHMRRLLRGVRQLRPRHQGLAVISTNAHSPAKMPHLQGAEPDQGADLIWAIPAAASPAPTSSNGTT